MIEQDYPHIQRTDRPDDVIGHPDVDAVVIATLPSTHYAFAHRALENGKEVFVELDKYFEDQRHQTVKIDREDFHYLKDYIKMLEEK